VSDPEIATPWLEPDVGEGLQEAPEGCFLTRKHLARSKRKQAMKRNGRLVCEVCGFDFAVNYGNRGFGFIECHHTKPVAALAEGHKTPQFDQTRFPKSNPEKFCLRSGLSYVADNSRVPGND
jgi:hypothetical protein